MSKRKLLVVLGVTGLQGGSVARVFSTLEPGWRIRGVTRHPDKASNAALREAGVELVAGDLDDASSLDAAFAGADAIFSVTDFWQFLAPSATATFAEAEQRKLPPNQVAMEREIVQGRNIVDAAARAHAAKPLHRFVLSVLSDSARWSGGAIRWNLHFDGKARYVEYLHATYPALAARASFLQMGYYLSNWHMMPAWRPRKEADGGFVLPTMALPDAKLTPYVDPPNDTGHFVRALVSSSAAPPGTTMLGTCEVLAVEEYARTWAEVLGKKARVEYTTYESAVEAGLAPWLSQEIAESGAYISKYGWAGGDPTVKLPVDAGVDVSQLTKVADWIKREDWSEVM